MQLVNILKSWKPTLALTILLGGSTFTYFKPTTYQVRIKSAHTEVINGQEIFIVHTDKRDFVVQQPWYGGNEYRTVQQSSLELQYHNAQVTAYGWRVRTQGLFENITDIQSTDMLSKK